MLVDEFNAGGGGQVEAQFPLLQPAVGARGHVEEVIWGIEVVGDASRPDNQLEELFEEVKKSHSIVVVIKFEAQPGGCLYVLLAVEVVESGVLAKLGDDLDDGIVRVYLFHF